MSNKVEFTLTRALVELKLFDSKITKAINELKPVSYAVKDNVIEHRQTIKEFIENYKSQMQSLSSLRENKNILKNALMKANTTTKVNIAGKEYTILEALNKKKDIEIEELIIEKLKNSLNNAIRQQNSVNDIVEDNIQSAITSKSGASGNHSKDYVEHIRTSMEDQKAVLVNDKAVSDLIQLKSQEIEDFKAEVDFALSEINAITKITLDFK